MHDDDYITDKIVKGIDTQRVALTWGNAEVTGTVIEVYNDAQPRVVVRLDGIDPEGEPDTVTVLLGAIRLIGGGTGDSDAMAVPQSTVDCHIQKLLDAWPPLSDRQIEQIARLLPQPAADEKSRSRGDVE